MSRHLSGFVDLDCNCGLAKRTSAEAPQRNTMSPPLPWLTARRPSLAVNVKSDGIHGLQSRICSTAGVLLVCFWRFFSVRSPGGESCESKARENLPLLIYKSLQKLQARRSPIPKPQTFKPQLLNRNPRQPQALDDPWATTANIYCCSCIDEVASWPSERSYTHKLDLPDCALLYILTCRCMCNVIFTYT